MRKIIVLLGLSSLYFFTFCQDGGERIKKAQYFTNGHKLYTLHCQNCHGAKGEGLGKLYPPLNDQHYLDENRDQLPLIVRFGLEGEIMVSDQPYDTPMPGNPTLTNTEIAYILTYITNAFGNDAPIFTMDEVARSF